MSADLIDHFYTVWYALGMQLDAETPDELGSVNLYFSDRFNVDPKDLESYGAFDISLVTDLPLFIDPFLLFNSKKPEYQELHEEIIRYLRFLRDKSATSQPGEGLIKSLYAFREIPQNWFGFSVSGNRGLGLGNNFAHALNANLAAVFKDFGTEKITKSSHLEKLCLLSDRIGRDTISDFTTNLVHGYLLKYTETFAKRYISASLRKVRTVDRVRFNYSTESWERDSFDLPQHEGDYVLLTPKDILTKDDTWINRHDLIDEFDVLPNALPDEQLRDQVNNYFRKRLPEKWQDEDRLRAIRATIGEFPQLIDAYIRHKEDTGQIARSVSESKVEYSSDLYVRQFGALVRLLEQTKFFRTPADTYNEAFERVMFLKDVVESKGGHRIFYVKGKPLEREEDVQILFRLTWFGTQSDVTREANDGRGPVDFKISRGASDKVLVEFKLAKNSQLKRNLEKQVPIYQKASDAQRSIKVIFFFSNEQRLRVQEILKELKLLDEKSIVLIDARNDNKPSGSKA